MVRKSKFRRKETLIKLATFVGFIVLVFASIGLGKEIYRRYQINQEIKKVKEEIERLEKRNKELQALVDYLNTDSYKEIQARQNLGLVKEGEVAVAIEPAPSNSDQKKATYEVENQENISNPRSWWNYFFETRE